MTADLDPESMATPDIGTGTDDPDETAGGVFLHWRGRRRSKVLVPAPRVLETVEAESDPTDDDPGNLVIEGDNRQAMSSLRFTYADQVDVVMIDPPYNTGKDDFRYSDRRFEDPDADESNGAYVTGSERGRHTKWLNEMAPTLRLIHDLLSPSGVIFVHINDIELPRLLLLMEDVFEEKNRLGMVVWKSATDNNPSRIAIEHEYIVVFAKDASKVPQVWQSLQTDIKQLLLDEFAKIRATHPDDLEGQRRAWRRLLRDHREEFVGMAHYNKIDADGVYTGMRSLHNPGREGYRYEVLHPNGQSVVQPLRGYRFPKDTMDDLLARDRILFGPDETQLLQLKVYLDEYEDTLRGVVNLDARTAANTFAALFPENPDVFKNAKPVELEEYLLSFAARNKSALILDCYAGSGTTGHAVMRLNKRDGGRRRFILIERGEEDDPYATTLTAERLRRARTHEELPGGFTFKRVGPTIDNHGLMRMERDSVAEVILLADASGRGGTIKPVRGELVIGANRRGEAICLSAGIHTDTAVDGGELRAMLEEAEERGLKTPMRVYGVSCEIYEDEFFRFFQLPDEVIRNLRSGRGGTR